MWVSITQYKDNPPKGPVPAKYIVSNSSARTDRNGEVAAILHESLATYIAVHSFDLWYNGPLIPVDEVFKTGVVLDYSAKGAPKGYWVDKHGHGSMKSGTLLNHNDTEGQATLKPVPQPGLIVFVERRITTWDRMRQELP